MNLIQGILQLAQSIKLYFLDVIRSVYLKRLIYEWHVFSIVISLFIVFNADFLLGSISHKLYDGLVRSGFYTDSNHANNEIVIIVIDDESIEMLGRWPWSRLYHKNIIDTLQVASPKVLAFNILFTEIDDDFGISLRFKESIANSKFPIILPVLEELGSDDFYFKTNNTLLSTIKIVPDKDGVIRRIKLLNMESKNLYPQLSLQAYWGAGYPFTAVDRWVKNLNGEHLILYKGDRNSYKKISYKDVILGNFSQAEFFGKTVFIGITATGLSDRFNTPINNFYSAIDVHAEIISNLIEDRFIYHVEYTASFALSLFFVFSYYMVILFFERVHLPYLVLLFSLFSMIACVAFFYFKLWWSPLNTITVFVTSWVLWSWRRYIAIVAWCHHLVQSNISLKVSKTNGFLNKVNTKYFIINDKIKPELDTLESLLDDAKKIESKKTKLKDFLSHDLRTPQINMLSLVKAQDNPNTAICDKEFKVKMEYFINESLGMLDDLLLLSKEGANSFLLQPVLLAGVVQDAIDFLWPQLKSNDINVFFNVAENQYGQILGDARLLLRAINNIIENSIKHAGKNTNIYIDLLENSNSVVLEIYDNGLHAGLNEISSCSTSSENGAFVEQSSILSRSYGLGLELVKMAMKLHKAELIFFNRKEGGMFFRFIFPR